MMQRMALVLKMLVTKRAVTIAVLTLWSGFAFATDAVPGEYLVKYKGQEIVSMTSLRSTPNVRILSQNRIGSYAKVAVNPATEAETLLSLLNNPNVETVTPNYIVHAFKTPATTLAGAVNLKPQWAIDKVNAPAAWKLAGNKGSHSILVSVIDTGADYKHESLVQNMVPGYNFKDSNDDPMDKTGGENPGHGTHCSGIIGATGLVDGGTVGISPEVSIMPLRFLDENGQGDLDSAVKAVDYAVAHKVRVISASWGMNANRSDVQPLIDSLKRADDAGVIFVVAAANDGRDNDTTEVYPTNAGFPNSISVAASGNQDEKPSWSNYGKRTVHVAAPGLDIMSTLPGNKYDNLSGTSMATPLVTGLAAFLLAQDPALTGVQLRALMQETGAKVNIETACNCRVDALAAVGVVKAKSLFIAPAAATLAPGDTLKFNGVYGSAPYTFSLSNAAIGALAADGTFTAKADGDTTVTVKDAKGATSTSLTITVATAAPPGNPPTKPPGGGGGLPTPPGGGTPGSCPLGDASICQIVCQVKPDLPFCKP